MPVWHAMHHRLYNRSRIKTIELEGTSFLVTGSCFAGGYPGGHCSDREPGGDKAHSNRHCREGHPGTGHWQQARQSQGSVSACGCKRSSDILPGGCHQRFGPCLLLHNGHLCGNHAERYTVLILCSQMPNRFHVVLPARKGVDRKLFSSCGIRDALLHLTIMCLAYKDVNAHHNKFAVLHKAA